MHKVWVAPKTHKTIWGPVEEIVFAPLRGANSVCREEVELFLSSVRNLSILAVVTVASFAVADTLGNKVITVRSQLWDFVELLERDGNLFLILSAGFWRHSISGRDDVVVLGLFLGDFGEGFWGGLSPESSFEVSSKDGFERFWFLGFW